MSKLFLLTLVLLLVGCSTLLKAQTGNNQIATATAVFTCGMDVANAIQEQLKSNASCQVK